MFIPTPHFTAMTLFLSPLSLQEAQPALLEAGSAPSPSPPQPVGECLALLEARHGEWPGESFHTVPQLSHASDRLRVLNQEVLEVLELS